MADRLTRTPKWHQSWPGTIGQLAWCGQGAAMLSPGLDQHRAGGQDPLVAGRRTRFDDHDHPSRGRCPTDQILLIGLGQLGQHVRRR